jgi:pyruvate/2-oxoglutarate dehydrogenase complex dihydrolipoamide dehydrogenase (E3) component
VCLRLGDGTVVAADRLLVATGRVPVTDGLGLADAGVEVDERGFIRTDESLATTAPGIWAIGDVTGRMPFTHAAGRMAFVAVANALSKVPLRKARFDPTPIPWVTFTSPEVARVGMIEREAADQGGRVAYLPLSDVDRGMITGDTDGFVKLIAGPRRLLGNAGGGRLLGATIVAPSGGELIGQVALAMRTNMFTGRLAQTTQAYPTWSMAIQEAAAQFFMDHRGRTARDARSE